MTACRRGGEQRARRRRSRRRRGVPARESLARREKQRRRSPPRPSIWAGRAGAAGARGGGGGDLRVAGERREDVGLCGKFSKKPVCFAGIANRSFFALKFGLRVRFSTLGGTFLQNRHGGVLEPSDHQRAAQIAVL